MSVGIWGAIGAFFTLLIALLRLWEKRDPKRRENKRYEKKQEIRKAILNGDVDRVNRLVDRMQNRVLEWRKFRKKG